MWFAGVGQPSVTSVVLGDHAFFTAEEILITGGISVIYNMHCTCLQIPVVSHTKIARFNRA